MEKAKTLKYTLEVNGDSFSPFWSDDPNSNRTFVTTMT